MAANICKHTIDTEMLYAYFKLFSLIWYMKINCGCCLEIIRLIKALMYLIRVEWNYTL